MCGAVFPWTVVSSYPHMQEARPMGAHLLGARLRTCLTNQTHAARTQLSIWRMNRSPAAGPGHPALHPEPVTLTVFVLPTLYVFAERCGPRATLAPCQLTKGLLIPFPLLVQSPHPCARRRAWAAKGAYLAARMSCFCCVWLLS